jgi:hypothetical protein
VPSTNAFGKPTTPSGTSQVARGESQPDLTVESLLRHLRIGSRIAFKVWYLHPVLIAIAIALGATAAVGALATLLYMIVHDVALIVGFNLRAISRGILYTIGLLLLGALFPLAKAWIARVRPALNPGSALTHVMVGVVMASVGWLVCRAHLWVFNPL